MAYASDSGMRDIFGSDNIDEYSDLNNNANAAEMAARIARAIVVADAYVDGYLRGAKYTTPVTEQDGTTTPPIVVDLADTFAGLWLMRPRGMATSSGRAGTQEPFGRLRREARRTVVEIRNGDIILDSP